MKPHLLEAIGRLYDAMNRRDFAALRQLGREHPDFSWESNADELDSPGRLDNKEVLAYSRELFEIFDELETEIIERIDVGPDHVIFVVRHRVRGAASGVRVDRQEVHLWTVRGDRVESLREYRTVAEARDAAAAT
ncbi:MAG TPA: nuclear transport factor 2 family protein [Thermoleophilaceae bacterium]|nr:nuclear transport factor 2 family protein [Thermoleophilaceae bacterium]